MISKWSIYLYLGRPQLGHTIKTNFITFQTVDLEIHSILVFSKSLGLPSPPNFVYNFPRKIFFMSYSINWPMFTIWLDLLLVSCDKKLWQNSNYDFQRYTKLFNIITCISLKRGIVFQLRLHSCSVLLDLCHGISHLNYARRDTTFVICY